MSVIHPNFTLRCGDDWQFTGPLTDNSGNPLPLTGATLTWKLDSLDESTNILTLTLGSGISIITLSTATVEYGPTAAQTATIPPGTYYDTLRVTLAGGAGTFTVIEGIINASPSPT